MSATSVKHKIAPVFKMASKKAVKIYNSEKMRHICLETDMLKLSYKHLDLSYYCYFHVFFSLLKLHIYSRYHFVNGVRSH